MKSIAIIIRGKHNEAHEPGPFDQHADVVLSDGSPYGYFGEGVGFSADYGMFMDGVVYNYDVFKQKRPYYIDSEYAKRVNVISTICVIRVSDDVAVRFDQYWKNPKVRGKDSFSMLGNNCATHAAEAFRHAGVMKGGIPGLDTPDHLYHELKLRLGGNFKCTSGYIGFTPKGNQMKIDIRK
jgi:hypothetical protein